MKLQSLCFLFALAAVPGAVASSLTGPVYPPPGGVTFSGTGSIGSGIGRTGFYTSFDSSAYGDLYFGPSSVLDVYTTNAQAAMTFLGYDPITGIAEWQSTNNWTFVDGITSSTITNGTIFKFQAQNYTGVATGFIASGLALTNKGAVGATGNASDPLLHVTGNFQIQMEFITAGGTPVSDLFNADHGGPSQQVHTSESNGFYYSDPAPEPGTWVLMISALAGLVIISRRRLSSKA
jgi:hypothetical protein